MAAVALAGGGVVLSITFVIVIAALKMLAVRVTVALMQAGVVHRICWESARAREQGVRVSKRASSVFLLVCVLSRRSEGKSIDGRGLSSHSQCQVQ